MLEQSFNQNQFNEMSPKDAILFLIGSWKTIIVAGFLGVLASIGYLIIIPNEYQATAQIQMAQISANPSDKANSLGVNIEDPNLLIARLSLPTAHSDVVIRACGFEKTLFPGESLGASLKLTVVKGVSSMIDLKVNRDSKEVAFNCAQALFESIKNSQNQIINPYIEESKALINKYEARLLAYQALISSKDKSGAELAASYLASRDEIRFLSEEVIRLNNLIAIANIRQTKLVSPIYAADSPVFPKKKISLMVGLMAGLIIGFLFAIAKKIN
jgi:capsular polysaccharide biosynthesis protein